MSFKGALILLESSLDPANSCRVHCHDPRQYVGSPRRDQDPVPNERSNAGKFATNGFNQRATQLGGMQQPSNPVVILALPLSREAVKQ
jgi:hypothetical protein